MTKKTSKFLLLAVFSLAAVIIILTISIRIFITPEKVKAFLIPEVEKALNRKITVGEIKISLLKGIAIKDFAIKEKDEKTDFVTCKDFVLKYKLFPLFLKKLLVDELTMLSPEIRITRSKEGEFNFEGVGRKQKPEEGNKAKQAAELKKLPVSLQINKVVVKDGRFSFIDSKEDLPDIKGSININAGLKSADGANLSSQGNVNLKLNEILFKKTSRKYRDFTAGLKYSLSLNLESNSIKIDKADLRIQELPVSISGAITNFKTAPEIDMTVSATKVKIAEMQKSFSSFVDVKGLALSGNLTTDLRLTGMPKELDTLKIKGNVILEKIGIAYSKTQALLDGNLIFNDLGMNIELKGTAGKNRAELRGNVSNYFKNQNIRLDVYSKQLFLDELAPLTGQETASVKQEKTPGQVPSEASPVDARLTAAGEIKIDAARYKGMTMNNLYAKYQLKNNKFEILKMTAAAGKGTFNVTSILDLSKPGYIYSGACTIDSLHADEVVNSFFPKAKDSIFGALSSNLKLNGAGTLPESMKRNLSADGDFTIREGKITNNKILENLALFLGIDELRTINLRQAHGTLKIKNSIARLDSIFLSDDLAMDPSGNIGLDETLDLAFDLKLSPRLTKKAMGSSVAKYIKDEEGWGLIPLKVSGTFAKPSYTVDIAKAGKRVLKKKTQELFEKLFNRDKGKTEEQGQTQQEKKPVEDLLKGIFK